MLAPADDYVAEFVRHMNPLDVLTGSMIMRERVQMTDSAGDLWLDAQRRYRLFLNGRDEVMDLHLDGVPHPMQLVGTSAAGTAAAEGLGQSLAIASPTLSLQEIIQLRETTGHPVLLAADGRIVGVCGEAEIIRALAGSRQTP